MLMFELFYIYMLTYHLSLLLLHLSFDQEIQKMPNSAPHIYISKEAESHTFL